MAVREGADLIYFPELSITGYEPQFADPLATELSSTVFDIFQKLSDVHEAIIGIGPPFLQKIIIYVCCYG